jgi:hypothetical protein
MSVHYRTGGREYKRIVCRQGLGERVSALPDHDVLPGARKVPCHGDAVLHFSVSPPGVAGAGAVGCGDGTQSGASAFIMTMSRATGIF